ncbi:head-tail joining protein [Agarilytica rhodophyticola]|uniref:head-tail joining protein n=1 Tax=Agarilytica rhodophyticola TaxID=1737490 RepID=UPI000B34574F|nr:hypothetical protein [Agarilytica rhodophyticola]
MDSRMIFSRAIDSQFTRLGRDAMYVSSASPPYECRVIPRRPEHLLSLGEHRVHTEDPHIEFRVSEIPSPVKGDEIIVDGRTYRIEEEPRLDQHQLIWHTETLPV